jgi:GAF domain-containing protein
MGVKGSALRLLDKDSREFHLSGAWGLSEEYLFKGPVTADYSIAECLRGKIVHIPDVQNDPQIQYPEDAGAEGIGSILSVPMIVRERVVGVLRLYTSEPRTYSEEELQFVQMLADLGTLALEHARLYSGLKEAHDSLIDDFHSWFETSTYNPVSQTEPVGFYR